MKYYLTTPIYYPNDKLHIGHAYTTVAADVIARYKKLRGYDVYFLTGTDEHGQKIERAAASAGVTPKEFLDKIIDWIKELWKEMNIEYDDFIRTTDERHVKAVQKIFKRLYDKGEIYKSEYEGLYCAPCETFFTKTQAPDGVCPDCKRPLESVKEESYFFRLSKYQGALTKLFEENPDFLLPASRRNEMINNFLKPGLEDLCVSRTSFKWGIPVSFDPGHIVYVWIDALSNYITALGYDSDDDSLFQKYWPADLHLMAKEIVRFHSIIWPAILMALDIPLPKRVFGHGWLVFGGKKMGKSTGNVVDPKILIGRYGVDAIRFFLMREAVFGQDGVYSNELLLNRINADLANDLGNLVSRTVGMIEKYFNGELPTDFELTQPGKDFSKFVLDSVGEIETLMDDLKLNDAVAKTWEIISRANKFIDETEPWKLFKDESKRAELAANMYVLAETLRIVSILISPVAPNSSPPIREQLGVAEKLAWNDAKKFGLLNKNVKVKKLPPLFPRIDVKKELAELEAISESL